MKRGLMIAVAGCCVVSLGALAQERDLLPDAAARVLPPGGLLRPETTLAALMGLEVDRQIAEQALVADLKRLAAWRARRDGELGRLQALYTELDLSFNTDEEGSPAEVADLEQRVLDTESRLHGLGSEGRQLRHRIRERRLRLQVLAVKVDEMIALLPDDTETLTGVWDIRMAPTSENGVFSLYQTGTLLAGEYVLDGGWHGSLQGTVVDGKVYLDRIDSRKGKFASFSGRLTTDGQTIRGTWKERDLTANRPVEGSWVAGKRPLERPSSP